MNNSNEAGKLLAAHVGKDVAYLVDIDERPWVAITPLCAQLHIDDAAQLRRLLRHERTSGLELKHGAYLEAKEIWALIPLEELSWWLRTLRPSNPLSAAKLQTWRTTMPWCLIARWVNRHGRYTSQKTLKEGLHATSPEYKPTPPKARGRITVQQAEAGKGFVAQGFSQVKAARLAGMSPSTLNQILLGKYPVQLRDESELYPESAVCSACGSILNA